MTISVLRGQSMNSKNAKVFLRFSETFLSVSKCQLFSFLSFTTSPLKSIVTISSSSSICTTTLRWVSACSTVVEHSQQEGFSEYRCQRHVKPPTWRRIKDLERSNFRHKRPPASEATLANPAVEGGTKGEKWPRILPKVATSTLLLGSFACRNRRDRRLYFPSEGRRVEDFFARKILRLRLGLNPRTRIPKASTLTLDHRSRYCMYYQV
jgi:hypothetical protein